VPSSYQKSISSGVKAITQKLQKSQVRKSKVNSPRSPSSYLSNMGSKYTGVTASKDKMGGDSKRMTEYLRSYIKEKQTFSRMMKTTAGSSDMQLDSTDSQDKALRAR
jgi:hypothetical protein